MTGHRITVKEEPTPWKELKNPSYIEPFEYDLSINALEGHFREHCTCGTGKLPRIDKHRCTCPACGRRGPAGKDDNDAIDKWNMVMQAEQRVKERERCQKK